MAYQSKNYADIERDVENYGTGKYTASQKSFTDFQSLARKYGYAASDEDRRRGMPDLPYDLISTISGQAEWNADRKTSQGLPSLKFGAADYNPYAHDDNDNQVWGDFVGKYNRLPTQQEFESDKAKFLTDKQVKSTKAQFSLLGVPYKAGDTFTNNNTWQALGFKYNPNDIVDIQRQEAGLPPKSYTSKYNLSDPEDETRLKDGLPPKYFDNTQSAIQEKNDIEQQAMNLAAQNKIHSAQDIMNLFDSEKYPFLQSVDDYITAYNKAVASGESHTAYDKLTGKSTKMPWQHVDLDALKNAGINVQKDANGNLSENWMDDLFNKAKADEEQKYGLSAATSGVLKNIGGWFQETPYEAQQREQKAQGQAAPANTSSMVGPAAGSTGFGMPYSAPAALNPSQTPAPTTSAIPTQAVQAPSREDILAHVKDELAKGVYDEDSKATIKLPNYKYNGNIDLTKRILPLTHNADRSYSTLDSVSFNEDGKEILVPSVIKNAQGEWYIPYLPKGKIGDYGRIDINKIIDYYHKTGEFLGKFDDWHQADAAGIAIHDILASYYDQDSDKLVNPYATATPAATPTTAPTSAPVSAPLQSGIAGGLSALRNAASGPTQNAQSGNSTFGSVTSAAWHQGNAQTGAAFARTAADFNSLFDRNDPFAVLQDITANPDSYNDLAKKAADALSSKPVTGIGKLLPVETGANKFGTSVKQYLDQGYKITDLVPGTTQFDPVTIRQGDASDEQKQHDLLGVLHGLGVIGGNVEQAVEAKKMTASAQQDAQAAQSNNGALNAWAGLVSNVTPTAVGVGLNVVNPIAGDAFWAAYGYGSGAEEARLEGATPEQQKEYGLVSGVTQTAIGMFQGKLFNGAVMKAGAKAAATSLSKTGLNALMQIGGFTAAMDLQQIALNAAKKGIYKPKMAWVGKDGVVDPAQLASVAENGAAMSAVLQILGFSGGKAKDYILKTANSGEAPNVEQAVVLARDDAKTDPQAAEFVKEYDDAKGQQDTAAASPATESPSGSKDELAAATPAGQGTEAAQEPSGSTTEPAAATPLSGGETAAPVEGVAAASQETTTATEAKPAPTKNTVTGEETFTPTTIEDLDTGSDSPLVATRGDLTPFQEKLLTEVGINPERRAQVEKVYSEYRDELNNEIDDTISHMKENGGKGVTIVNDAESGQTRRISNNEKWYRDLFAESGKAPSNERLKTAAVEMMLDDNNELYNPDFAQKFEAYKEMKPLMDRISKGGDILSVDKQEDGSYKVTYGTKAETKAAAGEKYELGIQGRAAAAGYGTNPQNLIDAFLEVKDSAEKVDTPKARSIAKNAQKILDQLTESLRSDMEGVEMSGKSQRQVNLLINSYEGQLKDLIGELQGEVRAAKSKAKADLTALRQRRDEKLSAAEKKRQEDVLAMRVKKNEEMAKKLAKAEAKRRIDLANLRNSKNASFEWKHTAPAVKKLREQITGKTKRPVPKEYSAFINETLEGLDRKGPGGRTAGVVNVDKFASWLGGLDEDGMAEAGIDAEDKARVQGWMNEVKGKDVRTMTYEEHQALGKLVRRMSHLSDSYYTFFGKQRHLEIQAVRDDTVKMLDRTDKDKTYEQQHDNPKLAQKTLNRFWGYAALKPYTAVKFLLHDVGETPARRILSDDLRQSDHDYADMNMKDLEAKHQIFGKAKQAAWSSKTSVLQEFKLESGDTVRLTKSEQVWTWLNSKNDFNREAMLNGVKFKTTGTEMKPSEGDIAAIAQHVENTPELKAVGEKLLERFNGEFKNRANSTSQALYGYDIASIENYVPVTRSTEGRMTQFQTIGKTLESFNWTKQRSGSKVPMVGWDIFDMYDNMSLETAQYAAYAVAVKNAQRLIGSGQVRTKVIEKRGQFAFDYYKRLLGDVAERGRQPEDTTGSTLDTVRRNAQAGIMSSPWVMANQYAQVPAMFSYIKGRYAISGLKLRMPAGDIEAMRTYAPELYARRIFGGMSEAAEFRNVAGDNPSVGQRIRNLSTYGVGLNDTVTINFAWEAAKAQVRGENKGLTGDAYWKKVGDLASNAIEETQPSHGLFTRSLFENTKTPVERLLFMFSGGPNAVWNMGADAIAEARWGGKEGKEKAGRLIGGIVASQVAYGLIAATRSAVTNHSMKDWSADVGKQVMLAFLTVPYFANIPVSYLQGFDTRFQGLDQLQKIITYGSSLVTTAITPVEYAKTDTPAQRTAKDQAHAAKLWGGVRNIVMQLSTLSGIPVYQIDRDLIKPALKASSESDYAKYLEFFGQAAPYSADFRAAADVQNPNMDNTAEARGILQAQVDEKGKSAVESSWHSSAWYKALSPADKRFWDAALNNMRQHQ